MKGFTIGIGQPYNRWAKFAAQRMREFTGLECFVLDGSIGASNLEDIWMARYRLFDFCNDNDILYFDADAICCKPWHPQDFTNGAFCAVLDNPTGDWLLKRIKELGLRIESYVNSGLWIANRKNHRDFFKTILNRYKSYTKKVGISIRQRDSFITFDQDILNHFLDELGIEVRILPDRFNSKRDGAIVRHFLGKSQHKLLGSII